MKCSFCGTEVDDKQRFCPNCGLLLDLSFTPYSVKDIEKPQEKREEPEFLRQKREYQESLDKEEAEVTVDSQVVEEAEVTEEEVEETEKFDKQAVSEDTEVTEEAEATERAEKLDDQAVSEEAEAIEESELEEEAKRTKESELEEEAKRTKESEVEKEAKLTEESEVEEKVKRTEESEIKEEVELTEESNVDENSEPGNDSEETEESKLAEEDVEADKAEEAKQVDNIEASEPEFVNGYDDAAYSALLDEESELSDDTFDEVFSDGSDEIFDDEVEEDSEKDFVKDFSVLSRREEVLQDMSDDKIVTDNSFEKLNDINSLEKEEEEKSEIKNTEEDLAEESFSPDAKIFSIQEKKDEEDFFGEIPDDPDDFRDRSSIPPTSMKELKSGLPSKKIIACTAAVAILGFAGINYLNSPKVRYDSFLKKGEQFIKGEKYSEAVESLEKDKSSFQLDARYYLLLSEAQKNAGKHEDAIASILEGQKHFSDNQELKDALNLLDPKLSSDIREELYHDSFEIKLESSSGGKIIYSLSGGKEEISQAEYTGPIAIKRNGSYTLMAYGLASDGARGELYTKSFTVDLDKEKYHLSSFVDLDGGKGYIDENGDQAIGWTLIDNAYYYFNENGIMQTGFLELDGEKYYLDSDGKMHTGRLDLDGKSYYFDEQGHMVRDAWIENRYYVDENGEMLKNQSNSDGIYFDQNGNRSFDAKALYEEHPDSILAIVSKDRKKDGNKYIFKAKVYYHKKNGRPSGDPAYETEIVLAENAMMHYLDENLENITAKDAVSFLPNLYLQEIVQDKDGVITRFGFVLGERRG
ncbi:MAG: cell wall-binding protein [Oribacterium parvum]|uniref:zinc-ribbon domain-containing protein n=1 Tax=Oribacterium parvum TaxID=1501329 RepID=UPI001CADFB59|nr:zinc-ribbon domain-containing protein [Oribacterium parvum]MBF1268689.1 cell wall-binding protein [Oribacterium parvum]